ncbi:GNAT family N-acetyltransferase [Paenibacillus marinisediminis]
MQLETNRLWIRDLTMEDWKDVHVYASHSEVTKHMTWGPNSEEDTIAHIEQQLVKQQSPERTDYEFAVVLRETNQLIGGCGIYIMGRNAEIGYCFNQEYWGNGYATEAARAMLKLGYETFNVHRVFATCRPMNKGSANVLMKIGMKQEGHLREHLWHRGKYLDSYLFSILEHEYNLDKEMGDEPLSKQ